MQRDPTTSASALNAKAVEVRLNEASDLIAGTLEQPADPRAWEVLLIYCPKDLLEKRLRRIAEREREQVTEDKLEPPGRALCSDLAEVGRSAAP
jgi:hypothetical protein